jgi:hypothetical protein
MDTLREWTTSMSITAVKVVPWLVLWTLAVMPAFVAGAGGPDPVSSHSDAEALELGHRVLAVQDALRNPGAPGSMDAVLALGHDSRHYVMVRGWLVQRLQGARSILQASRVTPRPDLEEQIAFLEKAIRAIDLE